MTILVIDAPCLCHMARHTLGELTWENVKTGVIFGFLKRVLFYAEKYETNKFIFTWDSKKSFRSQIFPDYKIKRKQATKELTEDEIMIMKEEFKQFTILRQIVIPNLGFKNNFVQTGYESDDLIAVAVSSSIKDKKIIISSDNDMLQLLTSDVKIYNPMSKKEVTEESFRNAWGIDPSLWSEAKSISGCGTDDVPGVKGVKEKTAIKFLKGEMKASSELFWRIKNSEELIQRNRKLVSLPYEGTQSLKVDFNETFKLTNFKAIFSQYGCYSFMKNPLLQKWIDCLGVIYE